MKITYKLGDLLEAEERVILHGCNGRGVMGSGVAKAIREKYPMVFGPYYAMMNNERRIELGIIIPVDCGRHIVINAITQASYGSAPGVRYVSYDAVADVMKKVNDWPYWRSNPPFLAMPKIGAGLGGGSWPIIAAIIEDALINVTPVVYSLEEPL